jgi:hypothetical protein
MAIHEHDPNFSIDTINKAKQFLNDPEVLENPHLHSKLIHEMYVEAALMDNHSPYPEVRAVVSNKDDPTLPVRPVWCGKRLLTCEELHGTSMGTWYRVRDPWCIHQSAVRYPTTEDRSGSQCGPIAHLYVSYPHKE